MSRKKSDEMMNGLDDQEDVIAIEGEQPSSPRQSSSVVVGCKLPNGIVLEHPLDSTKKVVINGLNKATIVGAKYAVTTIDSDFWAEWIKIHKDFPAVLSGSIFVAQTSASVASIAREYQDRKTGFEGMDQEAGGVKAAKGD